MCSKKSEKYQQKNALKNSRFFVVFDLGAPKNGAPVWEWWQFQENLLKIRYFEAAFWSLFDLKIKFFTYSSDAQGPESIVICISNSIFSIKCSKTKPPKNTKNNIKKHQNKVLDPSKWSSRRSKTLGFEKSSFLAKKRKPKKWAVFMLMCVAPNPVFYQQFLRF